MSDPACSDPMCSYRAEITAEYWVGSGWKDRAEAAEAERDRLAEALRELVEETPASYIEVRSIAREALASLEDKP